MAELDTLIDLVKAGELGKVQGLLSANFLLASQRLASGESPLMAALYRGHHDIVDAVIEAGAEIDIFAAAATGRIEDLRLRLSLVDEVVRHIDPARSHEHRAPDRNPA